MGRLILAALARRPALQAPSPPCCRASQHRESLDPDTHGGTTCSAPGDVVVAHGRLPAGVANALALAAEGRSGTGGAYRSGVARAEAPTPLEQALGHTFADRDLLRGRSPTAPRPGRLQRAPRVLGDAVLEFVVTAHLYAFSGATRRDDQGAHLGVSQDALAEWPRRRRGEAVLLDAGERRPAAEKPSILADTWRRSWGVYLTAGWSGPGVSCACGAAAGARSEAPGSGHQVAAAGGPGAGRQVPLRLRREAPTMPGSSLPRWCRGRILGSGTGPRRRRRNRRRPGRLELLAAEGGADA